MSVLRARDLTTDVKRDFEFVCFISDTPISQEFTNVLRNFNVKHLSYEPELFLNRDFKHFQEQGLTVLWVDITKMKALGWLQINVAKPERYRLINVYKVKSESNQWTKQLEEQVDNTLSLKTLMTIKSVNVSQFIETLVNYSKISKPKKWYIRLLMWIGKKCGIL